MNRIYRVIWNRAINCFIVTSELATGKTKSSRTQIVKPNWLRSALVISLSSSAIFCLSATTVNGQLLVDGSIEFRDRYDINTTAANQPAMIISNGGELTYTRGDSTTSGTSAHNVLVQTGSRLEMNYATLFTSAPNTYGIMLSGASTANVHNTTIIHFASTGSVGINVVGNSVFNGSNIIINSPYGGLQSNASKVDIKNLDLITRADNAVGIMGSGGDISVDSASIKTLGASAQGVSLINSAVANLSNVDIHTVGERAGGLRLASRSRINLRDSTITTIGDVAHGITLGGYSTANLINTTLDQTSAAGAVGINLSGGSRLIGDNITIKSSASGLQTNGSTVDVTNLNITTREDYAAGLSVTGGNVTIDGGSILTSGDGASAVSMRNWGLIKLQNMNITTLSPTATAFHLGGTNLDADNITINSAGQAIRVGVGSFNGNSLRINQSGSNIAVSGNPSTAINLSNSQIKLLDSGAIGIQVTSGATKLDNVMISGHTSGKGLEMVSGAFSAKNLDIRMDNLNTADNSAAMALRANSSTASSIVDSSIIAIGKESRALTLSGALLSGLDIKNTQIAADHTAIQTSEDTLIALNVSGSTINAPILLSAGGTSTSPLPNRYIYLNASEASVLNGDVHINHSGMHDSRISLDSGSAWRGSASYLHTLDLSNSSWWNMTGNSNIGALNLADSSIIFSHDDGNFKTLTVEGDFNSSNGTLIMNSVMANDDSQHDTLQVKGNTSGQTNVIINNVGGGGAQTLQGIEVISVAGQSDGNFVQQGRIVAGAFDYRLKRGIGVAEKNWYLISEAVPVTPIIPVDPITPVIPVDPITPVIPVDPIGPIEPITEGGDIGPITPVKPNAMVYRPEAGSYLANMAATNNMFAMSLHDRGGETQYIDAITGERKVTSMWMRNIGGHTKSTDSSGQLKTQTNRYVMQLGGDMGKWTIGGDDSLHIGTIAGYGRAQSKTESTVNNLRSKGQVNGYSLGMYGTWYQNDFGRTGVYLSSSAQYSWFNNTVSGDGLTPEKYKSKGFTASIESGYTWKIGENSTRDSYYLQPSAELSWMGIESDDVFETNGTRVSSTGDNNVQTRLGMRAFIKSHNKSDDDKRRSFEPYVEANWIGNTKNFGSTLNGVNISQRGTKNIGELKVGIVGKINGNLDLWGNIGQQLGDKGYSDSSATLGLKVSF